MKSLTKTGALMPAAKYLGQGLVLLSLLALLVLLGAGVGRSHSASAPSGVRMAAPAGALAICPPNNP